MSVQVQEVDPGRGVRGLRIENEHLSVTTTPDKGADILSIRHQASGFDPMWVSPWGVRRPGLVPTAPGSHVAWMDAYAGGWQELFPNGGAACTLNGADLPFHGEASVSAWEWEVLPDGVRFFVRLVRSPFVLERTMRLAPDSPTLIVEGRAENKGRVPIEYMWSHHPAFGAPFLSGDCVIETNATRLLADPAAPGPLLEPGSEHAWPHIPSENGPIDLSRIPGEDEPRMLMAYLGGFPDDRAWYAIKNERDMSRVEFAWDPADFPYAWLWQELHGHTDGPWYGECYVMAIEPATSWPGGLAKVIATNGTHRIIQPGETISNALTVSLSKD
jgi:galactose mutarotase-like enzyme